MATECLSMMYAYGWGVKDYNKAKQYLNRLIEMGDEDSISVLADLMVSESESIEDKEEGFRTLKERAESSDPAAACILGIYHYENRMKDGSLDEAARWFKKSAEEGNGFACFYMGSIYSDESFDKHSDTEAFDWYLRGAQLRNMDCMDCLVECYRIGKGVEIMESEAANWETICRDTDMNLFNRPCGCRV